MDILVHAKTTNLIETLDSLGFQAIIEKYYYSCTRDEKGGRLHILFVQISKDEIYCDIHWDRRAHFMFLGVDYGQKPTQFFRKELEKALGENKISYQIIGGFSWLTRKNRALFRGLRI